MSKISFTKVISLTLALIFVFTLCGNFSVFAENTDIAYTAADSMVLFTYDSDLHPGSNMTVDAQAMGLQGDVTYKWYKNKQLYATTQGITFTEDDVESKFYVEVNNNGTTYKSYTIVPAKTPDYYGYTQLTDTQKVVYDILLENIKNYVTDFDIDYSLGITEEDFSLVNTVLVNDHPELFWYSGHMPYYYREPDRFIVRALPQYYLDREIANEDQIKQAQAVVKNELFYTVSQMYSELAIATEYTKSLWVHDKVASMLTYAYTNNDQTIYGALKEKKAVCAGYSKLNQMLLQHIGLDSYTVTGISLNPTTNEYVNHAWNLMWIDHHCLYTDVTWDDQLNHVFHLYFARTVDNMSVNHYLDEVSDAIKPDGDEHCCEYNYFAYYHQDHALQSDENGNFDVKQIANLKEEKIKGKAWGIVVYDVTGGDFTQWLNSNRNKYLSEILNNMQLPPGSYTVASLNMGSHTLGTEIHIYYEKVEQGTPTAYTISGNVKSYGNENDAVTVSLFKENETEFSQQVVLFGNDVKFSFDVLNPGEYILQVKKNGHITSTATLTVNGNLNVKLNMYLRGDSDSDGTVSVIDAAQIQKYLAGIVAFDDRQLIICDCDRNGDINILDATRIQMYLASKIDSL